MGIRLGNLLRSRNLKLNPNCDLANLAILAHTCTQESPLPLGGMGGGGGNGRGRKIGRGSGRLTTSLSQCNEKVYRKVFFWGGGMWMVFYGVHDVRGLGGF